MGNNKEIQRQQYNRTVTMLKQYRDAQFFIQHTTDEESRQRTEAAVQHITAALEEIQRRRQQAEREEEYTALRMYYMQGYTYEQIEKELNTGSITLCWDNLEALCQDCHNKEHHAKNVRAKRYAFTADGELIPPIQKNIFRSR